MRLFRRGERDNYLSLVSSDLHRNKLYHFPAGHQHPATCIDLCKGSQQSVSVQLEPGIKRDPHINASEISFSEYGVDEYKILAGSSIRPLENEIKVSLSLTAVLDNESYELSYIIKKIYNTNELNPLAENQRKEFIVMQSLDEIVQQINMEISKIEMQSIKS